MKALLLLLKLFSNLLPTIYQPSRFPAPEKHVTLLDALPRTSTQPSLLSASEPRRDQKSPRPTKYLCSLRFFLLCPSLLSSHIIFPPANSDHDLTSGGMPSCLGNLAFMHRAKRRAVCSQTQREKGQPMHPQFHHLSASPRSNGPYLVKETLGKQSEHTLGSIKSGTPKSTAFLLMT
jgi:hypothetical protein